MEQFRLDGRTAIVTGVGPGIGETVARAYAAAGANVVMCARTAHRVEALAEQIVAAGGHAIGVRADVAKRENLVSAVAAARDAFGPVTIVFNNAATRGAVGMGMPGLDLDDDEWQRAFDINLFAPFRLAQLVVADMQSAGEGSITNVLSTAGFTPVPNIGAWSYGSTKAGLEMLTRFMAKELGPDVRVNCICPGTITADGQMRDVWLPLVERIPLGRIGLARETAAAALFLASRASSYVTGQTIFIDGGRVNTVA
jgi:NAD(P)-dependent dehydrogenase (short-subunit alcohol dehydrogenase family)